MSDRCPICASDVAVTPALFPGGQDRWECTECAAWGLGLGSETVKAVRERLKRPVVSMGVDITPGVRT